MTAGGSWGYGDVGSARRRVDNEHVGVGHAVTLAQCNVLIFAWCLDLEEDVSGTRRGSALRNVQFEADVIGRAYGADLGRGDGGWGE